MAPRAGARQGARSTGPSVTSSVADSTRRRRPVAERAEQWRSQIEARNLVALNWRLWVAIGRNYNAGADLTAPCKPGLLAPAPSHPLQIFWVDCPKTNWAQ